MSELHDPPEDLSPEERNRLYTARELVDLALDGHFCIRDGIDQAIRQIYSVCGQTGRDQIHGLPSLKAYASESEINEWEAQLLCLRDQLLSDVRTQRRER